MELFAAPLDLTYRPASLDDLVGCLDTLQRCYGDDPVLVARLPGVWRRLMEDRAMIAPVLEDRSAPLTDRRRRIRTLGASVFVTDAFAAEVREGRCPLVGAQIARRILADRSPVLTFPEIQRANRKNGLNLCVLHCDYRVPPRDMPEDGALIEKHIEMYFHYHCGYQLKEYLHEVYGEESRRWMVESGMEVRTDYAGIDSHELTRWRANGGGRDRGPYVIGLTRAEAYGRTGSRAFPMFVHTPAGLGFRLAEQELLLRALAGETDEELADSLNLSLSAIKKRWSAIYDRVWEAHLERVLGIDADEPADSRGRRGSERRRHLLNYLQNHPEELQPVNAAKGRASR